MTRSYIENILWYVLENAESEQPEEVIELFKRVVPEEKRGEVMSIADRFREEGVQKGIQKVAVKMLADKQNITFISRITGLSEAEIRNLQSSKEIAKDSQRKPH